MNELIIMNPQYAEWIRNIGSNFKQCQIKAASRVNEEMLRFYWNLGRDISMKCIVWRQILNRLLAILISLGVNNLLTILLMKIFFEFHGDIIFRF